MPSAIVATIGSASANSYITLADATTYFGNRLNAEVWDAATSDNQTKALLMATKRLERENWIGVRATSTQALAWPRGNAQKPDGTSASGGDYIPGAGALTSYRGGYGIYFSAFGETFDTDEIPQQVKDAQCELALAYLNGYGQSSSNNGTIKSFSADGFSVSLGDVRSSDALPEDVIRLIGALIRGPQLMRA